MTARPRDEDDATSPRMGASRVGSLRWFFQSKYKLMGRFLPELQDVAAAEDAEELSERYRRALKHGVRVQRARLVVTVLLAFGIVATVAAALLRFTFLPTVATAELLGLLDRIAALAASAATVLVALRLAFDRYLERVDVSATFLAMQLAASRRGP